MFLGEGYHLGWVGWVMGWSYWVWERGGEVKGHICAVLCYAHRLLDRVWWSCLRIFLGGFFVTTCCEDIHWGRHENDTAVYPGPLPPFAVRSRMARR